MCPRYSPWGQALTVFMCLALRTRNRIINLLQEWKNFWKNAQKVKLSTFSLPNGKWCTAGARSLWLLIDALLASLAYKTPSTAGGKYNFRNKK